MHNIDLFFLDVIAAVRYAYAIVLILFEEDEKAKILTNVCVHMPGKYVLISFMIAIIIVAISCTCFYFNLMLKSIKQELKHSIYLRKLFLILRCFLIWA